MTEKDVLETAFEIRATRMSGMMGGESDPPNAFVLTLEHACGRKSPKGVEKVEIDLAWFRCPWCSKRVPERIMRIFRQT